MVKSKFYNLDTDATLGGESTSDLYVASEKAVKSYVDTNTVSAVAAGSTANKISVTKNGSTSTITVNNVANATTASKIGSTDVGSATNPVYISGGTPIATTYTLGKSVPSDAVFTDTTYANGTGITIGTGNAINHSNSVTAGTAGSSSASSGSTVDVPYVTYDAQGHITASGTHTHTITGFATTDTKNTAGGDDTSSKIFLVGMTAQTTGNGSSRTYTQDTAFVDANGRLNSAAPASAANDTTVATTKWVKDQGYTGTTATIRTWS